MKYKMIMESIVRGMDKGIYKRGCRLPSIRIMASEYGVNKSTVMRAYEEMERKHIIYSIPKSGYYITGYSQSNSQPERYIDFSRLEPDEKLIPYREFIHCVNRVVDIYNRELFTYGSPQGLISLRKALAIYFRENDIYTHADNICITNGAHQALSILVNMQFPNGGSRILIEQPTYSEIYSMPFVNHTDFLTVNRDVVGLNMAEVERIFENGNVKFFYTMSRFHNPLGTNLPLNQKQKLLKLASKYDVYIVEDDYWADIKTGSTCLPLHYYDTEGRVIYLRSFSKSFMPGIRLGCAVMAEEMKGEFLHAKRGRDLGTSMLMQGAMELYLTNGMYNAHVKKINSVYLNKYRTLAVQLAYLDPEYRYITPVENSMICWLKTKDIKDAKNLPKRLLDEDIKVYDGCRHFLDKRANGIRLCIAPLSTDQIRRGINIIYSKL